MNIAARHSLQPLKLTHLMSSGEGHYENKGEYV